MYIIVYPLFTIVDHQVFSISFAPWTRFWVLNARWGWQHFQSAPAEPRQCPPGDPGDPGDPRSPGTAKIRQKSVVLFP